MKPVFENDSDRHLLTELCGGSVRDLIDSEMSDARVLVDKIYKDKTELREKPLPPEGVRGDRAHW